MSLRRRLAASAALLVAVVVVTPVALAADPRADDPKGAAAVVTTTSTSATGVITFTGTGFTTNGRGDTINVKVDDGVILLAENKSDEWGAFKANADGTVTGTVDLARAHPESPLSPGRHWLRFLTGREAGDTLRTLHADFTVVVPASTTPADPGVTPPTTGGSAPSPTTPVSTTPVIVRTGPIWLTETTTKPSKTKLSLKVKAGALGSAGKVSVRTIDKLKVGKGKPKRWLVAKSDAYFVDKLEATTLRLKLTPEGQTLIKRNKVLKVTVTLADANGEDTVNQEVWVSR